MKKRYEVVFLIGICGVILTGCGRYKPSVDQSMRLERIKDVREQMRREQVQEPIQGTLTFSTAIARAIKYNLDHKVKQMETAVAQKHLSWEKMSFLPNVAVQAGYTSRNNDAGAYSRSLNSGEISLESSTSQEKNHTLTSLRAAWDVVDFGLAYYSVQQKTNDINIAEEQRRKVVQNIIQDVQEAYWRAYIAQEISSDINDIIDQSREALAKYKNLGNNGQITPTEALAQQREILQVRYNLRSLQEQLSQGKIHLAALLNLPANTSIHLAPIKKVDLPQLVGGTEQLEDCALRNRPELRMEDSKLKTTRAEIKKSILEMFPHLEFWGQYTHDANEYLYNNSWSEAGVQLTWQLLNVAKNGVGRKSAMEAEEELADSRHKALSMAIISQVHLALNRYEVACAKYSDASELAQVSGKLASLVNIDTVREGKQGFNKIRANLQATSTNMESMLAYAEVQNALMRLYNTLGTDPLDNYSVNVPIADIAKQVEKHFKKIYNSLSIQ